MKEKTQETAIVPTTETTMAISEQTVKLVEKCTTIGNSRHPLNQGCDTLLGVRVFDTGRI